MTGLVCLSVPGYRVPLGLLERLAFPADLLEGALEDLRRRSGATQLCVLSTCERTEVYAGWDDGPDPRRLAQAVAANRGVPVGVVTDAATVLTGPDVARHLLRVTAGLESFVLGERDIVGQVRAAAEASRSAGLMHLELDRLVAAAVNTSRRVHRHTSFGRDGRSVAAAAVTEAAAARGNGLTGCRVLVVGAGQVAAEVVATAGGLGAAVTVCNRTRRHADRFAAAGATVADLARLVEEVAGADVVIFATAAPHRLLDATQLQSARQEPGHPLLVLDLCVPRNVDPVIRGVPGVRLVDLADLRAAGVEAGDAVAEDVARAEKVIEQELSRLLRWLGERAAAGLVRRLRADAEVCAREEAARVTQDCPEEVRALVEDGLRRVVRRLAHGPTKRLLAAAEAGDADLAGLLAGLFAELD